MPHTQTHTVILQIYCDIWDKRDHLWLRNNTKQKLTVLVQIMFLLKIYRVWKRWLSRKEWPISKIDFNKTHYMTYLLLMLFAKVYENECLNVCYSFSQKPLNGFGWNFTFYPNIITAKTCENCLPFYSKTSEQTAYISEYHITYCLPRKPTYTRVKFG